MPNRRYSPAAIALIVGLFIGPLGTDSRVMAESPKGKAPGAVGASAAERPNPSPILSSAENKNVARVVALNAVATRLDSPRFIEREAASRELTDARTPAVAALQRVAKDGSLEAAVRAVSILEAIYIASGAIEESALEQLDLPYDNLIRAYLLVDLREAQTAADAAEFALDELVHTGRAPIADRADVILESHYEIRERRAVAEIERLHGKVTFGDPPNSSLFWKAGANPLPQVVDPARSPSRRHGELMWVIIGPKWSGGDAGLRQVARLKRLKTLYRIIGTHVTDAAILRLRSEIPGLEVPIRAAAKLGIEHRGYPTNSGDRGCEIESVKEGEAAANAGLRPHDVILTFAGLPVNNFESLIELLYRYNPGDVVEATIIRNRAPMSVQLTLTGWD